MHRVRWLKNKSRTLIPFTRRAILICAATAFFCIGLAGCFQETPTTSVTTATTQASSSSPSATTGESADKTPFTHADLIVNGIKVGATPEEAEKVFGTPRQRLTEKDQVTGLDLIIDTYDGLQLTFINNSTIDSLFHLKYVEASERGYEFARGIMVGDSVPAVIRAFSSITDGKDYHSYTVIYGDPVQLENQDTSGEVAFAYYNDKEVRFIHMVPPYMSGMATIYDEISSLNLTVENHVVTKIFWSFSPGAE